MNSRHPIDVYRFLLPARKASYSKAVIIPVPSFLGLIEVITGDAGPNGRLAETQRPKDLCCPKSRSLIFDSCWWNI
jgi:hypothetical protein